MDILHLRSQLAPAIAALFLVLTLCSVSIQSSQSAGIQIPLLKLRHRTDLISCDGRWEFVQLLNDGTTKIDEKLIPTKDLPFQVNKIMKSRAERVIYVVPYDGIPYSRFLETLSSLRTEDSSLHIGVLTGKVRAAYMQHGFGRTSLPCDIEWPAGEF